MAHRIRAVAAGASSQEAGIRPTGRRTSDRGHLDRNRTATLDPRVHAASLAHREGPRYAFYTCEEHRDLKAARRSYLLSVDYPIASSAPVCRCQNAHGGPKPEGQDSDGFSLGLRRVF